MTCSVEKLAEDVLCHLGSEDEVRWNKKQVINIINMGAATIMASDLAEEDFARVISKELVGPGCVFDLSQDCEKILDVVSQGSCDVRDRPDNIRNDLMRRYRDFCDKPEEEYELSNWNIKNKQYLVVNPEIPEGVTVTVELSCVEKIPTFCAGDSLPEKLCTKYASALWSLVIGTVYSSINDDPDAANACVKLSDQYVRHLTLAVGANETTREG